MSDSGYALGSRAIKIPLYKQNERESLTSSRERKKDKQPHRDGSNEVSDEGSSSSSSSSRTREVLLNTRKPIPSPSVMHTPNTFHYTQESNMSYQSKDKQRANLTPPNTVPQRALNASYTHNSPLSPSMLSSSSYKSVNLSSGLGDSDEPTRIITYTKHSQGFTWNDELFLPSYMIGRRYRHGASKARRRWGDEFDDDMDGADDFDEDIDHCPVTDIFVTDEEAAAMLP